MASDSQPNSDGGTTAPGFDAPQLLAALPGGRAFFSEQVRVGRYDLIYRLGSGGMAAVFVGRLSGPAGFERLVAVKIIHQHLADSEKFINMFLDEARMAASIHHPNVVEIHEVGQDKGLFYMVGEFVNGPDLGRLLRRMEERGTVLPPAVAAYVAAQVCFGLHAAHETRGKDGKPLNLIHRDISPNNVLISYDGYVKLIDFGVAWAKNKLAHTESGALKGKIGYISPEQILGHETDRRSDIFSVGVLLYIMSTLSHPFPGKSDAERLNRIISGDMKRPSEVREDVHPGIERIVLKAMASAPENRYATSLEMGRDLEAFIESLDETVKSEDLAAILDELFQGEKVGHESSITAYRAARDADATSAADEEFGSYGSAASSYAPLPPHQRRSMLLPALGVLAAAAIGVLFYMYWGGGDSTDPVADRPTEDAPAAAASDVGAASAQPKEPGEEAAPGTVAPASENASPPQSEGIADPKVVPSDATEAPADTPGQKRRKPKSKKGGSGLLHSPYS